MTRVQTQLKRTLRTTDVSNGAAVYLAAVLEYLTAEVGAVSKIGGRVWGAECDIE